MENKRNHKIPEIGTKKFNDLASKYFEGKPKEKSSRQLALEWWRKLMDGHKLDLMFEYKITGFTHRDPNTLTGSEIEKIWDKVMNEIKDEISELKQKRLNLAKEIAENSTYGADSKNHPINRKQFFEFNPELFKAYISKFSEEDKVKALNVLVCSISTTDIKFNSLLNQISDYR